MATARKWFGLSSPASGVTMPCRSASASLPVAMSYGAPIRRRRHRPHQRRHRVRRRAVHPDLAVPVQRHEPPGRVDQRVDDGEVELVPLGDRGPVVDARTAERVGADPHTCGPDRVQVERGRQVVDVRPEVVVGPGGRGRAGPGQRHPAYVGQPAAQDLVGPVLDPAGDVAAGGAAVRRVVLEAAVARRVVRRGDHDAVGAGGIVRPVRSRLCRRIACDTAGVGV